MSRLSSYLADPVLNDMYAMIRGAGPVRPISLDITAKCNLRCTGCYYFAEGMDRVDARRDDTAFDTLLDAEAERGTNFVTVVGGEPALVPERLKKIYDRFKMNVATNGLIRIPAEGLEDMPLGIALWGNRRTDARLRADESRDLFSLALKNYRDDPRAFFYYTVAPGHAHEIEAVVEDSREDLEATVKTAETPAASGPLAEDPISDTIQFDDFAKLDLRIARIIKADHVEGADKLLQLTLDLGGETRNVFAGIKSAYAPEDLEGKLTVMVANLAPRKMRFGVSEGMVLAAGGAPERMIQLFNACVGWMPGGMAAVAGNNWPIIRTDRGGRGLATSVGVVVGIAPILIIWPAIWSAT